MRKSAGCNDITITHNVETSNTFDRGRHLPNTCYVSAPLAQWLMHWSLTNATWVRSPVSAREMVHVCGHQFGQVDSI